MSGFLASVVTRSQGWKSELSNPGTGNRNSIRPFLGGRAVAQRRHFAAPNSTQQFDCDIGLPQYFPIAISDRALSHKRDAILNPRHVGAISAVWNVLEA